MAPIGSLHEEKYVYLSILDQLTGFGLNEEEAEYTVNLARDVLEKNVEWNDDSAEGWKRFGLKVHAGNGAPVELTHLRLAVQRAASTSDTKSADARHNAFDLFAIATAAASAKPQAVRVISFGEGTRYEFAFRASLNGRDTLGFLRIRKTESGNDAVPAGGALSVYEAHRKEATVIDTMTARRAKDLLPAA